MVGQFPFPGLAWAFRRLELKRRQATGKTGRPHKGQDFQRLK
jgi:hypothetical protein